MPALAAPLDRSTLSPLTGVPMLSDPTLVRGCRRGEERAFELIYDRYHTPLYRYCRSLMGNHEDAEESLQTTMMKAYRALRTAERDVALKPWLFRIAHNECMRALSGRRLHAELSGMEEAVGAGSQERAEVRADLEELRRDLAALPTEQRSALLLREMCGLSHREIGESLGAAPEAVKQLIYEARQTLHEFGEGRSLACADVRVRLSEGDGRVLRARRMRAHLRTCSGCQAFRERLVKRPVQLAALFPVLPAAAARWVLQAVLGGGSAGSTGILVSAGLGGAGLKIAAAAAVALVAGAAALPSAPFSASPAGTPWSAAAAAGAVRSAFPSTAAGAGAIPLAAPGARQIASAPTGGLDPVTGARAPLAADPGGASGALRTDQAAATAPPGAPAGASPGIVPAPAAATGTGSSPAQPRDPGAAGSAASGGTTVPPASAPDALTPLPSVGPISTPALPPAPTPALPPVKVPTLPTLPAATVPSVTVPSVTVPAVTPPPVTVPSVTVPPVTVPSVTPPPVTVPAVTVPAVTVPAVTVPSATVPQVATPAITTPQPPALPALPGLG